jgi:hypothetical protein
MQVTDHGAVPAYSAPAVNLRESVMERNVGGFDRGLRIVAGLALLAWTLLGTGDARWWGLIGLPLLGTGLLGWCPAYLPFGIKTCKPQ